MVATGPRELARLTSALQGALTLHEVQRAYLDGVDAIVGARAHGLYHLDPDTSRPLHFAGHVPDGFVEEYERMGRDGDPIFQRAAASRRPTDDSRALSEANWRRTPVYDVLRRRGFGHSLEAPLLVAGQLIGTLNLARRPNDDPFAVRDLRTIAATAEQVQLALHCAVRFEVTGERTRALERALDAVPQALVVSRLDGDVVWRNAAARGLLGDTCSPQFPRGPAPSPVERAIDGGVARLRSRRRPASAVVDLPDAGGRRLVVRTVAVDGDDDVAVSFVTRSETNEGPVAEPVALSPREREIVEFVGRGLSNRAISQRAYISENTVKMHLKRVFGKLHVHSRAELVSAMWDGRVSGAGRPSASP